MTDSDEGGFIFLPVVERTPSAIAEKKVEKTIVSVGW